MFEGELQNVVQGGRQVRREGIRSLGNLIEFLGVVLRIGQSIAGNGLQELGQVIKGDVGNGLNISEAIQDFQTGVTKDVGERFGALVFAGAQIEKR